MNNIEEIFNNAKQYHQNNKLDLAENLYKQILLIESSNHEVIHLLGILYSQKKLYSEAIEYIKKAIEINNHPMYINNLAENYRRLGEFDQAILNFKKVIQIAPNFAEAYFNLANTLKQKGDFIEAENNYLEAIRINSNHFKAYFNLGNLLLDQKRFSQAVIYYQQTLKLNPDFIEATNNLKIANDFLEQENNKLTDINNTLDILGIAKTLMNQGNYDQAIKYYNRAKEIYPNDADIYNNLGFIFSKLSEWDQSLKCYQKVVLLNPNFTIGYQNLAKINEIQGKTAEAKNCYQKILEIEPENILLQLYKETLDPAIFSSNEEIENYQNDLSLTIERYQDINLTDDLDKLHDSGLRIPVSLVYQGKEDCMLRAKYASLFDNIFPSTSHKINKDKPHIGFVVTDGHEGIFTSSMKGIINNLSDKKFQLTIICPEKSGRKIIQPAITNIGVKYLYLPAKFSQMIDTIADVKFDLLYYWEIGTDATNYFLPFCRLAPVQCTSWGWQVTSGIKNVDYYISSEALETNASDNFYTETLIRLKNLPTYYYKTPFPKVFKERTDYGFTKNQHIYLCPQNLRKIHPDFDAFTIEILSRDPNAVYVLIEDYNPFITEMLKNRFKKTHAGLMSQIRFFPRIMSEPDYINLVNFSDLMLDTRYYGGVNTSYDAFAVGTPVVTFPSYFHRSRYTSALYQKMGIKDCIVNSKSEYIDLALKIAKNPEYRNYLSNKIKEVSPVIFEDRESIKELSDLFESLLYS